MNLLIGITSTLIGVIKKLIRATFPSSRGVLLIAGQSTDPSSGRFSFVFNDASLRVIKADRLSFSTILREILFRNVLIENLSGPLAGLAVLFSRQSVAIIHDPDRLSGLVLMGADRLVAFTSENAERLHRRGVPTSKIRLMPKVVSVSTRTAWETFYGEMGWSPSQPIQMPLDRCGMATREDLNSPVVKQLKEEMEKYHQDFLSLDKDVWKTWQWPRDVLNTWSRRWEYPYIFHHLQKLLPNGGTILDVGSGLHFFSFFLSERGYTVHGCDFDMALADHFPAISRQVKRPPTMTIADMEALPIKDKSIDAVVCLSVIEHLLDWEYFPKEFHRVLKPEGKLLVTLDVGLSETCRLSPARFQKIQQDFESYFDPVYPVRMASPQNLLTTGWVRSWDPKNVPSRKSSFSLYNLLTGRWGRFYYDLAVTGFVLKPKRF